MKTRFGKRSFMIEIAKLHECSILKVIFVNRNRFIILKFLEVAIEKYKKRELIVLPEP